MKPLITTLLVFLMIGVMGPIAHRALASDNEPVSKANWQLAKKWLPDKIYEHLYSDEVLPEWLPGSRCFWYRYLTHEGRTYWLVDPEVSTKCPLFDHKKLAIALNHHLNEPVDPKQLDLQSLKFMEGNATIRFTVAESTFEYVLKSESLSLLDEKKDSPKAEPSESNSSPSESTKESAADSEPVDLSWQNVSPDKTLCVFARGNDLYLMDPRDPDGAETRLTDDGVKCLSWGTEWEIIEDDDPKRRAVEAEWSPDSNFFAILRADVREVEDMWLVDHLAKPRPLLKTYKCPLPGEKVPQWELWIFRRQDKSMVRVETDRWPDQRLDDLFQKTLWWPGDSKGLYFVRRSRDFKKVDVCVADLRTGKSMTLIEERREGQVYIQPPTEVPGMGALWWSMRDGWGHLYLYNQFGQFQNQVTRGDFNVESVVHADAEKRVVYFLANGREKDRNPYYHHLYRVNLDGTGLECLTPEDAHHKVTMSPSKTCFVDSFSRVDLPTRTVVRDCDGKLLLELETMDISSLTKAGWQAPEIFSALSADNKAKQWGMIYKPFDFDPKKKYPILTRCYPGRQDEFIPKEFWPVNSETALAQLGFIVVRFGNLGGTFKRGSEYRDYRTEDFRDYGLADKKTVIEQLGERFDYIDLDRVGIYGSSSGGFMTVSAMLVYPDFFKAGVAMTSPNEPTLYYNQWVERYHGIEATQTKDGECTWKLKGAKGNVELAKNLKGDLLMIYGAQDTNVHPSHLFRMADAFIKEGKRFDMFMVPGAGHGLGDWRYLYSMIWEYFAEHLLDDSLSGADTLYHRAL